MQGKQDQFEYTAYFEFFNAFIVFAQNLIQWQHKLPGERKGKQNRSIHWTLAQ